MTISDGVGVNVTVDVGIAVFVGILVVVFVGVAVESEIRVEQLVNALIVMAIITSMNDFELAFNIILDTPFTTLYAQRLTACVTCAGAGTAKPSSQKNAQA
jgi:hypothetical protein